MYSRASLGELLALTFLPLVFCGLYQVFIKNEKKWYVLVIAMTGIVESHILTFVMVVICCVVFALFHLKCLMEKKRILALVKAVVVTILLNIWFLLPFLEVSRMEVIAMSAGTEFYNTPLYMMLGSKHIVSTIPFL